MSTIAPAGFVFEHTYARDLPELVEPWQAAQAPAPGLLVLNTELVQGLGLDPEALRSEDGVQRLVGNVVPEGAAPVAMAYAGHQFGGYSPRLGDGRALLLGEHVTADGRRVDVHLKGSGRTPFARGGDGKAAVGPMLREYVIGEAMHALGIPTTRALAVVATGEQIARDAWLPGAVLVRVAASHLRVGTFQYASAHGGPELVRRLADHAIRRHHPTAAASDRPYLALFEAVVEAQARLVAQWMLVGFVHGVMNTDNMTISGETIDYGPCAFMDRYHPSTVFSSIDEGGRYAYGNQPNIAQWNLARLAETLLPLVHTDVDLAVPMVTEVLHTFPERLTRHWADGMRRKLGLAAIDEGHDDDSADSADTAFFGELLALMAEHRLDHTGTFRALAASLRGDATPSQRATVEALEPWTTQWRERLAVSSDTAHDPAAAMDRVNPLYIPRNHMVEAALTAATDGDIAPFERLIDVVRRPFDARPGLEEYAGPAVDDGTPYRTFCGT